MACMASRRSRPGLAKTRAAAFVRQRQVEQWAAIDYRWRELFERADVMSEGAVRNEPNGAIYYGSTSVVLPVLSRGGLIPDEQVDLVARALSGDPHARTRAVRVAYLEAQLRAQQPMERLWADLTVRHDAHGITVGVDVEARLLRTGQKPLARARRASGR
jgi:hypothetical protein